MSNQQQCTCTVLQGGIGIQHAQIVWCPVCILRWDDSAALLQSCNLYGHSVIHHGVNNDPYPSFRTLFAAIYAKAVRRLYWDAWYGVETKLLHTRSVTRQLVRRFRGGKKYLSTPPVIG